MKSSLDHLHVVFLADENYMYVRASGRIDETPANDAEVWVRPPKGTAALEAGFLGFPTKCL